MRTSKRAFCLAFISSLLAVWLGCASQLVRPAPTHVERAQKDWPGTTLEELQDDRSLYVARCSGCHTLYLPGAFPAEHWRASVPEMRERSRLSTEQAERILRYLVVASEVGRAP